MKLAKLSLAAVLAAGSFSMANAAVSLEEAIKDVEIKGMLRYRLDGDRVKSKDAAGEKTVTDHKNMNSFRVDLGTKVKFDEYFTGNFGVRFYAKDGNGHQIKKGNVEYAPLNAQSTKEDNTDLLIRDINITYHNEDAKTTLIGGRQALDTFYTAGIIGDGVVVQNSMVPGVTFAAFYVANLDSNDSDRAVSVLKTAVKDDGTAMKKDEIELAKKNNTPINTRDYDIMNKSLYGIGILTNFDFVSANLWAAQLKDVATVYGLDAGLDLKLDDEMKVTAKAQVSQTDVDAKAKKEVAFANYGNEKGKTFDKFEIDSKSTDNLVDSTNYNVNVGFDMGIFNAKVGYASTGSKKGISTTTLHDSGNFETMGEILMDFNMTEGQKQFIYAGIGTQIDAFGAGFEYVNLTNKVKDDEYKTKGNEYVARLSYDYSKKLKFSGFYAFADTKYDKEKTEENKFRLEAKYSF